MKIIKFVIFLIFLFSCSTPKTHYLLKTDCTQISSNEFFNQIIPIIIREKFKIKEFDTIKGYLRAETIPLEIKKNKIIQYTIPSIDGDFGCCNKQIYVNWEIYYNKDSIIAIPNAIVLNLEYNTPISNIDTIKICFDENTLSVADTWYWNIKKGIEKICGNKIVIEKELDKTEPKQKKPFGERLY